MESVVIGFEDLFRFIQTRQIWCDQWTFLVGVGTFSTNNKTTLLQYIPDTIYDLTTHVIFS